MERGRGRERGRGDMKIFPLPFKLTREYGMDKSWRSMLSVCGDGRIIARVPFPSSSVLHGEGEGEGQGEG